MIKGLDNSNREIIPAIAGDRRDETAARSKLGFQCPECFGVRIEARQTRFEASPNRFLCVECGCQWGARS